MSKTNEPVLKPIKGQLRHPIDLLTPEQQEQLSRELENMARTQRRAAFEAGQLFIG